MNKSKIILNLILIFSIFTISVYSQELNDSEKLDKLQEYNDTAYNIYILLSGLFGILIFGAFMMILVYHDWKSAMFFLAIVALTIGIIMT